MGSLGASACNPEADVAFRIVSVRDSSAQFEIGAVSRILAVDGASARGVLAKGVDLRAPGSFAPSTPHDFVSNGGLLTALAVEASLPPGGTAYVDVAAGKALLPAAPDPANRSGGLFVGPGNPAGISRYLAALLVYSDKTPLTDPATGKHEAVASAEAVWAMGPAATVASASAGAPGPHVAAHVAATRWRSVTPNGASHLPLSASFGASGLAPGTNYNAVAVLYDGSAGPSGGYAAVSPPVPFTTTVPPEVYVTSVLAGRTVIDVSTESRDLDSGYVLAAAAYDPAAFPGAAGALAVAGDVVKAAAQRVYTTGVWSPPPAAYAGANPPPAAADAASTSLSNLAPDTEYLALAAVADGVSVSHAPALTAVRTEPALSVAVAPPVAFYRRLEFDAEVVDTLSAATLEAVLRLASSGASGALVASACNALAGPTPPVGSNVSWSFSGLAPGESYVLGARVVSSPPGPPLTASEPPSDAHLAAPLAVGTRPLPALAFSGASVSFRQFSADAVASGLVTAGARVWLYVERDAPGVTEAAVVAGIRDGTLPAHTSLVPVPGAAVPYVHHGHSGAAGRPPLAPGTAYKAYAVLTEDAAAEFPPGTDPAEYTVYAALPFTTPAAPVLGPLSAAPTGPASADAAFSSEARAAHEVRVWAVLGSVTGTSGAVIPPSGYDPAAVAADPNFQSLTGGLVAPAPAPDPATGLYRAAGPASLSAAHDPALGGAHPLEENSREAPRGYVLYAAALADPGVPGPRAALAVAQATFRTDQVPDVGVTFTLVSDTEAAFDARVRDDDGGWRVRVAVSAGSPPSPAVVSSLHSLGAASPSCLFHAEDNSAESAASTDVTLSATASNLPASSDLSLVVLLSAGAGDPSPYLVRSVPFSTLATPSLTVSSVSSPGIGSLTFDAVVADGWGAQGPGGRPDDMPCELFVAWTPSGCNLPVSSLLAAPPVATLGGLPLSAPAPSRTLWGVSVPGAPPPGSNVDIHMTLRSVASHSYRLLDSVDLATRVGPVTTVPVGAMMAPLVLRASARAQALGSVAVETACNAAVGYERMPFAAHVSDTDLVAGGTSAAPLPFAFAVVPGHVSVSERAALAAAVLANAPPPTPPGPPAFLLSQTLQPGPTSDRTVSGLAFPGLAEASPYTAVAAVLDSSGAVALDHAFLYTRARPAVGASLIRATRGGASLAFTAGFPDPDPARPNSMAFAAAAYPAAAGWEASAARDLSAAILAGLPAASSFSNPDLAGAPVFAGTGLPAASCNYDVAADTLPVGPAAYNFAWMLLDQSTGASFSNYVPFVTRGDLAVAVRYASRTAFDIEVDADAALADANPSKGWTYRLEALAVEASLAGDVTDPANVDSLFSGGNPTKQTVSGPGEHLPTLAARVAFSGLKSLTAYEVVVRATEDSVGYSSFASLAVQTGASAPTLALATVSGTLDALTVFFESADLDSPHTVTARAYPSGTAPAPSSSAADLAAFLAADLAGLGTVPSAAAPPTPTPGEAGALGFASYASTGTPQLRSLTVTGLAPGTDYDLVLFASDPQGEWRALEFSGRTRDPTNYRGMAEWRDGDMTLTWRSGTLYTREVRGAAVGNGAVRARASLDRLACDSVRLAVRAAPGAAEWSRPSPSVEVADCSEITLEDPRAELYRQRTPALGQTPVVAGFARSGPAASPYWAGLLTQELSLLTSTCTTEAEAFPGAAAGLPGHPAPTSPAVPPGTPLVHTVYTPRGMGAFSVASLAISPPAPGGAAAADPDARLFHAVRAPRSVALAAAADDSEFSLAVSLSGSPGGRSIPVAVCKAAGFASASAYLAAPADDLRVVGSDTVSGAGLGSVLLRASLAPGRETRVTVVTVYCSASSFGGSRDSAARAAEASLLAAVQARSAGWTLPDDAVAARFRSDSVKAWAAAWQGTGVSLNPRTFSAAEIEEADGVRMALRVAAYRLLTSVRDSAYGAAGAATSAALVDDGGMPAFGAELYVLPALLYLRPMAAKALIESRHGELETARARAEATGLDGASFRFQLPQTLISPASAYSGPGGFLFATAMVAVAAFDYFKVSQDSRWLASKGYDIIAGVCDHIASVVEASGTGRLGDTLDINGALVRDPSLAVQTCRLALCAGIEAGYYLRAYVPESWVRAWASVSHTFVRIPDPFGYSPSGTVDILAYGADYQAPPAAPAPPPPPTLLALEPLLTLQGHFRRPQHDPLGNSVSPPRPLADVAYLAAALSHYTAAESPGYAPDVHNRLFKLGIGAATARTNDRTLSDPDSDYRGLLALLEDSTFDVWGSLANPRQGIAPDSENDLSVSALLLLVFVTGFAGVRIAGGFNQDGSVYENLGLTALAGSARFAREWASVTVSTQLGVRVPGQFGAHSTGKTVTVTNDNPY